MLDTLVQPGAVLIPATSVFGLWLIPALPILGAAINGLFGAKLMQRFGPQVNHFIAIALPSGSLVIVFIAWAKLIVLPPERRALWDNVLPFLHVGLLDADLAFWFDPLSAVMALVITVIGLLIHMYSIGYMAGDQGYWRFFAYLNLFMGAMLTLVLADNFLVMFIGWEGVGLCSYLLISFWYQEKANAVAGNKAFIVNRIGDFGFLLAMVLLFWGQQGYYQGELFSPERYKLGTFASSNIDKLESLILDEQSRLGFSEVKQLPPTSIRFDAIRARINKDQNLWSEKSPTKKTFMGFPLVVIVLHSLTPSADRHVKSPRYRSAF